MALHVGLVLKHSSPVVTATCGPVGTILIRGFELSFGLDGSWRAGTLIRNQIAAI